jgi:hypothetical protein
MRDLLFLAIHLLVTLAKFLGPGGVRGVAAESLLLKIHHSLYRCNDGRWFDVTRTEESASGEIMALIGLEAADWCRRHEVTPDLIARYFGTAKSVQPEPETWSLLTKKWAASGTED